MAEEDGCFSFAKHKTILNYYAICVIIIYFLSFFAHVTNDKIIDKNYRDNQWVACGTHKCIHGLCKNSSLSQCECFPGWRGTFCNSCGGRLRLNASSGHIQDGIGNYTTDIKCSWLIEGTPGVSIRLRFEHFATECGWDHLYVYDGDSTFAPLIAVFSGLVVGPDSVNHTIPEISARSGAVFLHFYSDAAYNMSGFNIFYSMGTCPLNCSNHGTCNYDTEECTCNAGWKGDGCETEMCPNNCGDNGRCFDGKCVCSSEYRGADCSSTYQRGVWTLEETSGEVPSGRASHRTVIHNNELWVISGDHLGNQPFHQLSKYSFSSKFWQPVFPATALKPLRRYGHTAVLYNNGHQNRIYMYGGMAENLVREDLWSFDIGTLLWHKHLPTFGEARAVVGHTAHMIDGIMYVIFGHSPIYGYMNTVQECNMTVHDEYIWQLANTTGAIVKGGYGHSSVYDINTKLIYVHGGYHSLSSGTYILQESLYAYDPIARHWQIRHSSPDKKYLHSAAIISGLMLVFGGNTHNDTAVSQGAKCYSNDFLAYDMECNTWHKLDSSALHDRIARFGHSADVFEDEMYIFGGFTGVMRSDMFKYTPADCYRFDQDEDEDACLDSREGVKCVWVDELKCARKEYATQRFAMKSAGRHITRCPDLPISDDMNVCMGLKTCPSCLETTYNCKWCHKGCTAEPCEVEEGQVEIQTYQQCPADVGAAQCGLLDNCHACHYGNVCQWKDASPSQECVIRPETHAVTDDITRNACKQSCYSHNTCENCTLSGCMWCSSRKMCVESNSYVANFPYGQCMEWTTEKLKCAATRCTERTSCEKALQSPLCGWCDDGSNTGLGRSLEGGNEGAMSLVGNMYEVDEHLCPLDRWYFTSCPLCQCNGHSTCINGTGICEECADLTTGPHCESCIDGYYGSAVNAGNCTRCDCNGRAETCDNETGTCNCHAKGVGGPKCNVCEEKYKHLPNHGGTCFYDLTTDFQFTFNLSKESDKHYAQINFMNIPHTADRDVDFKINCSGDALMNMTVKSNSRPEERMMISAHLCHDFNMKFLHKEYEFGTSDNTTFFVYLYDFKTPFWLMISYSQFPQIDLVHFFVTFFSCFLALLLIAAVFWKVKQRYDLYRQRQQMVVQMEQMASRPFAVTPIEIENMQIPVNPKRDAETLSLTRRKKPTKPSPVAFEPVSGQKAAVISLLVRLPMGDEDYTPPGQSGFVIGSAFVSLGASRKQSFDHSREKSRARKQMNSSGPQCV